MPATWGRVPGWWFQRLRETGAGVLARDVLVVLAQHAGKPKGQYPGLAWPSIDAIARTLGASPRKIQGAIAQLKAAGVLIVWRRNRRKGESNVYKLAIDGEPFQVTDSVTKSLEELGDQNGHLNNADSERLGDQIGSDYLTDSGQNQFPGPCSNACGNRPIEPTKEPTVLTTFVPPDALRAPAEPKSNKKETDERDFERIIGAFGVPALNGSRKMLEREARRLLALCPSSEQRDRLIGFLEDAFDPFVSDPEQNVTQKIASAYGQSCKPVEATA